jgi:aminoglycoside phosphotransferase (APT) family kinase protein
MNPDLLDKANWKVVSPPPSLTVATIEALLAEWRGNASVITAEPLAGGIMNWNYRIRLSSSVEWFVLRFYDRSPESCAKEVKTLDLVRDDVPVPRVLFAEPGGAGGYPAFCVLEFIEGISLRELRRRGDAKALADASYDAGRLLPRLQRHRFDRAGRLSPTLAVENDAFAGASLVDVVDHFARSPVFAGRLDAALRDQLRSFVRATEPLHGSPTEIASLTHGDFNSPNILVRPEGSRWGVAAILDWEFAFSGSIFSDIGNMLRYERPGQSRYEPHFSRGLLEGGWEPTSDWFLRARLADLPALCELLTRDDVPDVIVAELSELIAETVST